MLKFILPLFLIHICAYADWNDFKKEFRKTLRSNNIFAVQQQLEKCSAFDQVEAAEYLLSLMGSNRTPVQYKMTIQRVLSGYKNEDVRKLLVKETGSSKIGLQILQALTTQMDEHARSVCEDIALKSNDSKKLTIAIRAIGRMADHKPELLKKLISLLEPRNDTSVRRAATEALGSIKSLESAPYLINLMKDKPVAELAIDSIQRLTGQRFGNNPSEWKKWLAANKDAKPVNQPLGDYLEEKRKAEEAKRAEAKNNDSAEFYGVEIRGEKILFVLDHSGSMSAKTEYGNRLDQLKKEFSEMLDGLSYKISLGVLWFPSNATYPRLGIDEASDTFKERLKKHMQKIQPTGGTPIGEAMTLAFEKIVEKREIDAIYLLSDGAPNGSPDSIRTLIQNLNSSHFIKIHTISIGQESEFMKNVAADNYGTYTEIK